MAALQQAVRAKGYGQWDLSDLGVQPDLLMDIFSRLPLEAGGDWEWQGAVTLDLSYNRLGTLTMEQLRELVRAVKQRPWLRVRL
eukprot:CAMPEP_0202906370 /NCGR_PEP_ID=MMETSP1392-20130828/38620_1 /ASSEMBLY_ACC=CAM_ASM_000868 /TAXON_ID=225041 /ORGANISM="Chlamydomonas chlamydogama, Strain SAG 11-48b" /LENGTH=83 /DNA_ID=CAMNT_0049594849 /DNA_START=333 /DNA_END=580 /DNA_ORIENTATION=-